MRRVQRFPKRGGAVLAAALLCVLALSRAPRSGLGQTVVPAPSVIPAPAVSPAGPFAASVSVYFSPRGGAQRAVVAAIDDAKTTIVIQAFDFTSLVIRDAVVRALGRGVRVLLLVDRKNRTNPRSVVPALMRSGALVAVDHTNGFAHSKVMVIDGAIIITGSFNWSDAAESRNTDNLLVLRDCPELVRQYERAIWARLAHGEGYLKGTPPPVALPAP